MSSSWDLASCGDWLLAPRRDVEVRTGRMTPQRVATVPRGDVAFDRLEGGALLVRFTGTWLLHSTRPPLADAGLGLGAGDVRRVTFDTSELRAWDSSLVT